MSKNITLHVTNSTRAPPDRLRFSIYTQHKRVLTHPRFPSFSVPIGIPLMFLTLLYEVKEELKALDPDIKSDKKLTKLLSPKAARVKFLFASYNPKSWYAEVVECTRRLLLDGFVAVICQGGSNGAAGSLIGMMLAGCYCFSWREQMAFKVSTTNAVSAKPYSNCCPLHSA